MDEAPACVDGRVVQQPVHWAGTAPGQAVLDLLGMRGPEGGAWVYPEPNRVRLVTDGAVTRRVAEDLTALCRWVESRAGMRLYPAGETPGAGADRSLDPAEAFLGR